MTTQTITNVNWNSGVEMNNVHCPRCGAECFNTWGLVEHLKTCTGAQLVDVAQNGLELSLFPWEVASEVMADAEAAVAAKEGPLAGWPWSNDPSIEDDEDEEEGDEFDDDSLDQWDRLGEDDDEDDETEDPTEMGDSLNFDMFLAQYRATNTKRELTTAEQAQFNAGWDLFFVGRIPDHMTRLQRAGYEAAKAQFEDEIAAERRMFGQLVNGGL